MYNRLAIILQFLDSYVTRRQPLQIDTDFKDPDAHPLLTLTSRQLFKKLAQ